MRKLLLLGGLAVAASLFGGCVMVCEDYHPVRPPCVIYEPAPPVIYGPPPVIEVVPVPPPPPYWYGHRYYYHGRHW